MSQDQLIILLLKIGLVAGLVSIALWACVYTWLARWWENPVGRTLIAAEALVGALFIFQILSLFFNLNRLDSRIVAWADVALIGLVAPAMLWRTIVFLRMGPSPDRKHRDQWRAILSIFAKYASHAPRLGRKHRDPVEAPSPQDKEY